MQRLEKKRRLWDLRLVLRVGLWLFKVFCDSLSRIPRTRVSAAAAAAADRAEQEESVPQF